VNDNVIACVTLLGFVCVMIFVMFAGCVSAPVDNTTTPTRSTLYSTDILHVNEDGMSDIYIVYIPKTHCMCHVYDDGYSGGISCIPCRDVPNGVCPNR
jgi:hypothetical protein